MISSASIPLFLYECPACRCKIPQFKGLFFQGIHILAEIECSCCDEIYFQTVPTGHAAHFSVAFCKNTPEKSRYKLETEEWLALPLIQSISSLSNKPASVSRKVFRDLEEVIILNALDDCFGHVILKLFNATRHLQQHPQKGLIIILPSRLEWLLPEGIAEAWLVDMPLRQIRFGVPGLDKWVKEQLKRYPSYHISKALIHPELKATEYLPYLKTSAFDLANFSEKKIQITFLWREDRLWLKSDLEQFLFLASKKYQVSILKNIFLRLQLKRFRSTAERIRKVLPEVNFTVAGMGAAFNNLKWCQQKIYREVNEQQEKDWCSLYASSHLVIGVHGSSMLIPSALSAGFIQLLPEDKLPHYGEDILPQHRGRLDQFLSRFLTVKSNSAAVAKQAVSVIQNFPFLFKTTKEYRDEVK